MLLTEENYYSQEANQEYMSVSQYKDFAGTYGKLACEEQALAKLSGAYVQPKSTALLVGSYVDHYFEGTLDEFKQTTPEIFTKGGDLKADYKQANDIIKRIERDEYFMTTMSGDKQTIMTGELFGTKWKIKMDSYLQNIAIVDLKIVESVNKLKWVPDIGYLDFIRYWGYDIQGAIYQEIVYQNTGKRLPFYISAATKEKTTRIKVIQVQQNYLNEAKTAVQYNMPHILDVKYGRVKPSRCNVCDYCAETEVLTGPISILDLTASI